MATCGTISAYVKGRCRCGECKATMSAYTKTMRERRGDDLRRQHNEGARARRRARGLRFERRAMTHGSLSQYNAGCRCELCRRAMSDYGFRRRAKNRKRAHGRLSTYAAGCRCSLCSRAWSADCRMRRYRSGWRPKNKSAAGHGASRYRWYGCRCDVCRAAVREASRKYRPASLGPRIAVSEVMPSLAHAPEVMTVLAVEMATEAMRYCPRGTQFDELVAIAWLNPGPPEQIARMFRKDTERHLYHYSGPERGHAGGDPSDFVRSME